MEKRKIATGLKQMSALGVRMLRYLEIMILKLSILSVSLVSVAF